MQLELEISDRQYDDISAFCKANNLQVQEYITSIITEKHSLNKFGDLNNIIPKAFEDSVVTVKKRGRPKKAVSEIEISQDKGTVSKTKDGGLTETGYGDSNIVEEKHKAVVKRKRTLKTI